MLSNELRHKFLTYFQKNGHTLQPSSPVIPHDDPTLLFINAGMNQFKDVFLGKTKRDFTRATTSQKCVRVGGKHNDLDNVGHTRRHLTFFEMLGNFSFGDYFKDEAIRFAWEVSTEVFEFDPKDLRVSVFTTDDEAFELWTKYLPADKIVRFGEKDNYWAMGDTGPCGPCTELYFDRGEAYGSNPNLQDDPDGERFMEFWNLVFMQDNRSSDQKVTPLPNPSIDTGAGLERIASLKLGVDSVFETDILRSIIAKVEEVSGKKYDFENKETAAAFRVIADHLRTLSFAIADGVQPSNVDRGYVLRKVLRRAVRYGKGLGFNTPFLGKILPRLIETMGDHFTELKNAEGRIEEILTLEEESFFRTLKRGGNLLNQTIERAAEHGNNISGDDAFKLKDTYGLPIEEILLLAKDAGMQVDLKRYEEQEKIARERSKKVHKKTDQIAESNIFEECAPTEFTGYSETTTSAKVTALTKDGEFVDALNAGEEGIVILDKSPFYAEMGGQVGDKGTLSEQFIVTDTLSPFKGVIAHVGKGAIKVGDAVEAKVDTERRNLIECNHTATHLLHYALTDILGPHVKQAGSVVDENRLRFDFSHHKSLTENEVRAIEKLVNDAIRGNDDVKTYELSYAEASKRKDIKQFFGDKYGNVVRVVDANPTKELCGGTHTAKTGNIGLFRILSEKSVASGVRRIEAVTGRIAEKFAYTPDNALAELASSLKTTKDKLKPKLQMVLDENQQLSQELKALKKERRGLLVKELLANKSTEKTPYISEIVEVDAKEIRELADELQGKLGRGVIALGYQFKGKCGILLRVSDDLVKEGMNAKELLADAAPLIGGGGGGKPNSAQAGGSIVDKLPKALEVILSKL